MPDSGNSSFRSLARTSAVSIPSESRQSSVSRISAPRGTAMVSSAMSLPHQRHVHALDFEAPADCRQRAPDAPEQVFVAAAAPERDAEGRVVDLEDRAGVV